ncbi:hypothetical protein MKZ38_006527 [Zalerion maritima]|uniref:S-adenosylmethionine-dependent methyltransferase-like protein n=1 Tax=Zalerion maritima TaxID=339359 RepID=A0AAD5RZ30_9PEZI|nr:hypothetical protein MKZ38_006527 [Zalerion maritima]
MLRSKGSKSSDSRQPQRPPRTPVEQQQQQRTGTSQPTHQQQQVQQHPPGSSGGVGGVPRNSGGGSSSSNSGGLISPQLSSGPHQHQQQLQDQQHQDQQQPVPSSSASSSTLTSSDPSRASQHFQKQHLEDLDELSQLQTQLQQQPPPQQHHPQDFLQRSPDGGNVHSSPKNSHPQHQQFLHHQQLQQQKQHPGHPADPNTAPELDSSQFADSVSRSQSHRYPHINPLQQQQQQQYGLQSSSLEDIPLSIQPQHQHQQQQQSVVQPFIISPLRPQGQQQPPPQGSPHLQHQQLHPLPLQGAPPHHHFQQQDNPLQQQQQQQQQPQPQRQEKQSARKLIKSFLGRGSGHRGNNSDSQSQSSSGSLKRQSSTRKPLHPASPPASLRTGPSQVSLDQPIEWQGQPQQQQHPTTQPSPLQPVGEFTVDPRFSTDLSNHDLLLQQQLQQQLSGTQPGHSQAANPHSTIRPVPSDPDGAQQYQEQLQYTLQLDHQQQQGYQHQQHQFAQQGDQQPYGQSIGEPSDLSQLEQQQTQYQGQYQQQPPTGTQPQFVGQLSTSQHRNPETVSQLSHESPVTDPDQRSTKNHSTQASPAVTYSQHIQDPQDQGGQQIPPPIQQQQQTMPTNPGSRRQDMEDAMRGQDLPPGPPPAYRQHNRPPGNNMNPLPPTPSGAGSQNTNFRPDQRFGEESQQQQPPSQGQQQHRGEHERNSPQPAAGEGAQPDKEMKELVTKYKNVKRLYFDGKNTIDQLNAQVEQLQNAIANQRMSQSRTMLDDNEYIKLFERLNGAINNLSFNIRKDWRSLPQWIERYVSSDALKTGKQEMTAVGRAIISRWVMEDVFNKCFHPGLDPVLSSSLKEIELNIRRNSYTLNMQEELNALTTKIVSWRMATLDGLDRRLNSPMASDHHAAFTAMATTNLTAYLFQYLAEPPPPGIEGSVCMIVELAIKIAASIPMESRDVAIVYPMPETPVRKELMDVEKTPLPPLPADDDAGSLAEEGKDKQGRSKPGMLTKLGPGLGRKGSTASSVMMPTTDPPSTSTGPPPRDPTLIRIAGFVTVEVRGRHHLYKTPVWTLA